MRYYFIAGEASGDLHGANLIAALKDKDATSEFRAWGGDKMQNQGAHIVKHYKYLAFMGFWEVAKNLKKILSYINFCKKDIKANGIKTDDPTAYCAGLVRQDPYLFTYNRGFVGKYLQQNMGSAPQQPAPKTEPQK